MATCPQCQTDSLDAAGSCVGCGHVLHAGHAVQVMTVSDTPPPAALAAPLPAPMVEPILTPPPPPPPPPPNRPPVPELPAIALSLRGKPEPVDSHPAEPTLRNRPAPVAAAAARDKVGATNAAVPVFAPTPAPATRVDLPAVAPATPPPPQVRPRLVVIRGMRLNAEFPVYEGRNTVGRFADKPVDIDLVAQEAEGQVWSSRFHAAITFAGGSVLIEDLNSLNGTWVNGARVPAGQQRLLKCEDVIQVGTVQLRLVFV